VDLHDLLEFVADGIEITPLESELFALAFSRLDQVLQASGAHDGRFAAFRAAIVAQPAQLVSALRRYGEMSELVNNSSAHGETHGNRK